MNSTACKLAIVAALEREVSGLIRNFNRVEREHEGRKFIFFERDEMVVVCGGIGFDPARRAAEAVFALYAPGALQSVGFAGALNASLHVGDIFVPAVIVDARDGSHVEIEGMGARGTLVSFMAVAGAAQKAKLAEAYAAQAVDMEAAAVAAAARAHGIRFTATKVISDGFNFELPETARFIDVHGRFRTASFIGFVALRPWLWGRIASLAINSNRAQKALSEHLERFRSQSNQVVEANIT